MLIMSIIGHGRQRAMTTVHGSIPRTRPGAARRLAPAVVPDLAYTPEVARETAHLYERVARVIFPVLPWRGAASGSPSGGSSVFPVLPWRGAAGGPASQAPANALRPLDDPDAPVAGDSVDAELPGEGPEDLSGPDDDDDLPE